MQRGPMTSLPEGLRVDMCLETEVIAVTQVGWGTHRQRQVPLSIFFFSSLPPFSDIQKILLREKSSVQSGSTSTFFGSGSAGGKVENMIQLSPL